MLSTQRKLSERNETDPLGTQHGQGSQEIEVELRVGALGNVSETLTAQTSIFGRNRGTGRGVHFEFIVAASTVAVACL